MKRGAGKAFGQACNERGRANEQRLCNACSKVGKEVSWFKGARLATPEEDAKGADVVVETSDLGPLFLQAKSSKTGARAFRKKGRPLLVEVIVVPEGNEERLEARTRAALAQLRSKLRAERSR